MKKHAILTVGPQYAGKSSFCKGIVSAHPDVVYVSRDEILMDLFGTVWLSQYSGKHSVGLDKMWEIVAEHLKQESTTLILDTWNGFTHERADIVQKLRSLGVDRVDAWCFTTPQETCFDWSLKREPVGEGRSEKWTQFRLESRRITCEANYQFFHSQPLGAYLFDEIFEINPLDLHPTDPFRLQVQPS